MPSVIQELAEDGVTLDYSYVSGRVQEWAARLSSLYDSLVAWIPELVGDRTQAVEMNEELMRTYGVPPVRLAVLRFSDQHGEVASFVPRGLWIIGANGRVDMFARTGQFLIIDRSDYPSPAHWEIAPALHRMESRALSADTLRQTLQ